MSNPVQILFRRLGRLLADWGLIDRGRGERIADLAWPRFLTMFARRSQRVADVAMVGLSIGPAGIAGLAFATVYWGLANSFALGLVGGTISQVSQRYGAEQQKDLDLAVKQSLWVGTLLVTPFVLVYWVVADPLVAVLSNDAATISHGADYLRYISIALLFTALNLIASRTLAGADDTQIAMAIRATGAVANIVFNTIFIFGLGMGAAGAALGTVLAEALITACFAWGFVVGSVPVVGRFPVRISVGPPYFDLVLTKQLLRITPPLMAQKLGRSLARFPLFAILALFGPTVVAAFEVARRIRNLLSAFGSGFSMSASSLVGQALGRHDESGADGFSRDTIRFSALIYLATAAVVFVFAAQFAQLFGDDPDTVAQTVPFIRVGAISFIGLGLSRTFEGVLKAAGDNQWSMYGRLFGQYLVLLPLTYLGTITTAGLFAVYLAIVLETWSAAAITGYRVFSGVWLRVSRAYRPEAG